MDGCSVRNGRRNCGSVSCGSVGCRRVRFSRESGGSVVVMGVGYLGR